MRPIDLIPGVSLLVVCGTGFVGALFTQAMHTSPDLPVWNGEWGVTWEKSLDQQVFVREPSVVAWAIVEYGLFKNGRPGVIVGDDDWLFTSEEFTLYPHDTNNLQRNLRTALAAADEIRQRGAKLVVVLVPAKARVEADHLGRYTVPDQVAARPGPFVAGLRAAAIDVFDVEPALREARVSNQVFLRTDTHWTPHGADAAAKAIASHVRAAGAGWVDSATVTRTQGPATPHSGDLLRYIPLGPFQRTMGPPADTIVTPIVAVDAGGGLLGDATIPATLVGTSYSDDTRWGFLGALQVAFSSDVLNAAAQGKGPFVSMAAYLDDRAWTTNPPQLVIWEIPERYLGVEYDLDEYGFWAEYGQQIRM